MWARLPRDLAERLILAQFLLAPSPAPVLSLKLSGANNTHSSDYFRSVTAAVSVACQSTIPDERDFSALLQAAACALIGSDQWVATLCLEDAQRSLFCATWSGSATSTTAFVMSGGDVRSMRQSLLRGDCRENVKLLIAASLPHLPHRRLQSFKLGAFPESEILLVGATA